MGTLGHYLREAREARGIDLRDAAQQTRISINYLKALEAEDFARLPGEVFVKGFLKNYGKFLRLDEAVVMLKYNETRPQQQPASPGPAASADDHQRHSPKPAPEAKQSTGMSVEPFLWGGGILVVLALFLFTALPQRKHDKPASVATAPSTTVAATSATTTMPTATAAARDKLYLEVVALENTWVLVRTDSSPQKKAVLNKGESLIWSAEARFLISFGSVEALKILLNGQELTVNEPRKAVVRDLVITASGIMEKKVQPDKPKPAAQSAKPKPKPLSTPTTTAAAGGPPATPLSPAGAESPPEAKPKPADTSHPAQ